MSHVFIVKIYSYIRMRILPVRRFRIVVRADTLVCVNKVSFKWVIYVVLLPYLKN